jgi:hypothetical protein
MVTALCCNVFSLVLVSANFFELQLEASTISVKQATNSFMCLYLMFFNGHMVHPFDHFPWFLRNSYGWFMCLYLMFF